MPDTDRLAARLDTVERALTGDDHGFATAGDATAANERIDDLDERVDDVERRLADLEAAVRALRGYVGNVEAVNEAVERRADTALAAARANDDTSSASQSRLPGDADGGKPAGGWQDAGAPAADGLDDEPDDGATETPGSEQFDGAETSAENSRDAVGSAWSGDRPDRWLARYDGARGGSTPAGEPSRRPDGDPGPDPERPRKSKPSPAPVSAPGAFEREERPAARSDSTGERAPAQSGSNRENWSLFEQVREVL
ncbi:MAG: hypothetical protein V5A23_06035 [Halobacteriales archaeon]